MCLHHGKGGNYMQGYLETTTLHAPLKIYYFRSILKEAALRKKLF